MTATVRDYFERGFPYAVGLDTSLTAEGGEAPRQIGVRVHLDFSANAVFVSLLLPQLPPDELEPTIIALLRDPTMLVQLDGLTNVTLPRGHLDMAGTRIRVERDASGLKLIQTTPDGAAVGSGELSFTRRAYVYLQQDLDHDLADRLRLFANANDLTVSFRGPSYATQVNDVLGPRGLIPAAPSGAAMGVQDPSADQDDHFMRLAIAEAKKCMLEPGPPRPRVGAVVVKDGRVLATAHRGETKPGDHAEFVALEKKLAGEDLSGVTVYTTLEPCTSRGEGKTPCAQRLIQRGVGRVVVAMLDPNLEIQGEGWAILHYAGIRVSVIGNEIGREYEAVSQEFFVHHRPDRTKPRKRLP